MEKTKEQLINFVMESSIHCCPGCKKVYSSRGNLKKHLMVNNIKCLRIIELLQQIENLKSSPNTNYSDIWDKYRLIYTTDEENISKLLSDETIIFNVNKKMKKVHLTHGTVENYFFNNSSCDILTSFRHASYVWKDIKNITMSVLYNHGLFMEIINTQNIFFEKTNTNKSIEIPRGIPIKQLPDNMIICISITINEGVSNEEPGLEFGNSIVNWSNITIDNFNVFEFEFDLNIHYNYDYTLYNNIYTVGDQKYIVSKKYNMYSDNLSYIQTEKFLENRPQSKFYEHINPDYIPSVVLQPFNVVSVICNDNTLIVKGELEKDSLYIHFTPTVVIIMKTNFIQNISSDINLLENSQQEISDNLVNNMLVSLTLNEKSITFKTITYDFDIKISNFCIKKVTNFYTGPLYKNIKPKYRSYLSAYINPENIIEDDFKRSVN